LHVLVRSKWMNSRQELRPGLRPLSAQHHLLLLQHPKTGAKPTKFPAQPAPFADHGGPAPHQARRQQGCQQRAGIPHCCINHLSSFRTLKHVLPRKLSSQAAKPLFLLPKSALRWQIKKKPKRFSVISYRQQQRITRSSEVTLHNQQPQRLPELGASKPFLLLNSKSSGLAKLSESESPSFATSHFAQTQESAQLLWREARAHVCGTHGCCSVNTRDVRRMPESQHIFSWERLALDSN